MLTAITGLIGGLLYPLFSVIFLFIDLLQGVFYQLAGIGTTTFQKGTNWFNNTPITAGNSGKETDTGLIYYLLTSDLIRNLFLSIFTLALFLIIIFTAMAFIKNAYATKQKTWQEIVGNAFKGLANFIFIPVCCLLGVWLGNILLVAINGATSSGGATQMSRKLFICCAYDANEYRNKEKLDQPDVDAIQALVNAYPIVDADGKAIGTVDFDANHSKTDVEYFASVVDQVYAQSNKEIVSWWSVETHYSLFNFNYVVLIVGGVFMLYVLVSLAYAMIKRMFILLMLFVISPAICAMYPLDEGSAVGNWKKEFIKYTIAAYGAIAGMNLFFSILPIVENIQLVSWGGAITNDIFQLLIMVSGLFVVKEFMGTLSGWIGGDNALSTGEGLRSNVKKSMDKYAKPAVNKTIGAFANLAGHQKSEGFWKGMGSSFKDTMLGTKNDKGDREGGLISFIGGDAVKNVKESIKSGKDGYKYGKNAAEKDEVERRKKAFEKQTEKETKKSIENFNNSTENSDQSLLQEVNRKGADKATFDYIKRATDAGLSEDDAYMNLLRVRNLNKDPDNKVTIRDLKQQYKDQDKLETKEKTAKERAEIRAEEAGMKQADMAAFAQAIVDALQKGQKPAGESKREREDSKAFKEMAEHLERLNRETRDVDRADGETSAKLSSAMENVMKSAPGGRNSGFAKQLGALMANGEELSVDKIKGSSVKVDNFEAIKSQVDEYNSALRDKKAVEEMAKETTKSFVDAIKETVKGNSDATKAIEKFEKSVDQSIDAVQKLAKEIQDLLKK